VGILDRLRPAKQFRTLSPKEADAAVAGGALLLDVRAQDEWDAGHAPLALHVPARRLAERVTRLPTGKELILICRSGSRSKTSAEVLAEKGLPVAHVSGGMRAWAKAGLPVVGQGGRPGSVA
jgi:rhodanese-related sulfurtransferase